MADNKFFYLFNDIDEKYIKEAHLPKDGLDMYPDYTQRPLKKRSIPFAIMSAAACAALVFGIVRLSGNIGDLRNVNSSEGTVISSGFGSYDPVYKLFGTPLPSNELEDFDYSEAVSSYRQTFSEELNKLLYSIPDASDTYCKAKTLADMVRCLYNTDAIRTEKAKAQKAYITINVPSQDSGFPGSTYYLYETGVRYDSFVRALRDVFGKDSADDLIRESRSNFYNYNGELYCTEEREIKEMELYGLVYTDYEIILNEDSEVIFNTVCYFDYADAEKLNRDEHFDPAEKDTYINQEGQRFIGTYANRLTKSNGIWKAENICTNFGDETLDSTFRNHEAKITDKVHLEGTPFPSDVHTEFTREDIPEEFTEELKKDENLTALLEQINDPEFTDYYYNARTLAETLALNEKSLPERSSCMGHDGGAIISFYDEYNQECDRYIELGYNYDSFFDFAHELFSSEVYNDLMSHGTYYNYNRELYHAATSFSENPLLAHSEYELISNTDEMIAFDTVCYHIRAEEYVPFVDKQTYDPSNKNRYETTRVSNVFVKTDGKWSAEAICFSGDLSAGGNEIKILTDDRNNMFKLLGEPLKESELADFRYEELLEYYRDEYEQDEQLTALLDSLGNPEVKEKYYQARALANVVAMAPGAGYETFSANAPENKAQIVMLKDTPLYHSAIIPSYSKGRIFRETGLKYDSFINALNDLFTEESAALILKQFPFFYGYNGELYCNMVTGGYAINLVHTEYEILENSSDTVKFNTINYYTLSDDDFADFNFTYDPEKKDSYARVEINNEFRYINGEWKTYEICLLGDCSSREGRLFQET